MKVLNPTVTVMLASHMKPVWLGSTLDSILRQTRLDIEVVVADSGAWLPSPPSQRWEMQRLHDTYAPHPLVTWVTLDQTWPTPLIDRACPYTYVWNRVIDAGLVRGKYVAVFTDDDLYAPTFVERMAGYLDDHPEAKAVYCAQEQTRLDDERWVPVRTLTADGPRGPGEFDGQVDMTQVMFRSACFTELPYPPFNEAPADDVCRHADGLFLERLAGMTGPVPNIPETLVIHRYTPDSTYN